MVEREPKLVKKNCSSYRIMHKKSKLVKTQNTLLLVYFYKPFDINVTANNLLLLLLLSLLSQSLLVFFLRISRVQTMHLERQSLKSIILFIHIIIIIIIITIIIITITTLLTSTQSSQSQSIKTKKKQQQQQKKKDLGQ